MDINCDVGESYGNFIIGNDEALFPYLTSCNIACGFHGGDPLTIEKTVKLAIKHNIRIGAHPSYPDLQGFGRRKMQLEKAELKANIKYQIAALKGICESLDAKLEYVKPHGALYNVAAKEENETMAIIEAMQEIDKNLALMGLAGSLMGEIAQKNNIKFISEAFVDRRYNADGSLMARNLEGSVLHNPQEAAEQFLNLSKNNYALTIDNQKVIINAQSLCIHGDNPFALDILKAITLLRSASLTQQC